MPSHVVLHRLSGEDRPGTLPAGTFVRDFEHDGDGGCVIRYEFQHDEERDHFVTLYGGEIFTSVPKARAAYAEAIRG